MSGERAVYIEIIKDCVAAVRPAASDEKILLRPDNISFIIRNSGKALIKS